MTSSTPSTASEAPWCAAFLSHLDQMESPTFTFTTLHAPTPPQVAPRARTVVFRGMWAAMPVNPKNPAERNPDVYCSDLPTLTSDARMQKMPELLGEPPGSGNRSGVGGPVEACVWAVAAKTQWRLRGRAYVVGPDIATAPAARVREAPLPHMRRTGTHGSWDWGRELTAHFGNLSPSMRGTFRNPPPGTPRHQTPKHGLGLGQKVTDVDDKVARENFQVVIVPEEVDQVNYSAPDSARRWNYTFKGVLEGGMGRWATTELWP